MAKGRGLASYPGNDSSISVSSRKIEGGWIVSESSNDDGEYHCREFFSESRPVLSASSGRGDRLGSAEGPEPNSNPMRAATREAKR